MSSVVDTVSKVWEIMKDNVPQLDHNTMIANAIPGGADWSQLSPAAGTNVKRINYHTEWDWGVSETSTDIVLKLAWAYGSRYHGGGAFIPSVYAWIESADVAWGNDVTITFQPGNPYLQGSESAPYAVLPIMVEFRETSPADDNHETYSYSLHGYGPATTN
ncbi:MAG: hypothetical protein M3Q48_05605 [Actinomycetota bacterium]|nr:hypothetical protein [Actinomycetota bacterium]HSH22479.1 hypothetical protein [Acidimicrobiales bacterium]